MLVSTNVQQLNDLSVGETRLIGGRGYRSDPDTQGCESHCLKLSLAYRDCAQRTSGMEIRSLC